LGSIYSAENVVLSATHTHSGPAGFLQYVLFEVSSLGFIEQTFNALVDGISRVCMDFLIQIHKLNFKR
jgi:neutral ceramidase